VSVEVKPYAYLNTPLPIGFDKTISQPLMVAVMIDLFELQPDGVVLEIGTCLGYQSAMLAELAGKCTASKSSNSSRNRRCCGSDEKASPTSTRTGQRLFRLVRAWPVRQGDRHRGVRPDPTYSINQLKAGGRMSFGSACLMPKSLSSPIRT
jgi:Protein-L-isoaspartate(D-aspartate) O-methyltransferase (PCMT)